MSLLSSYPLLLDQDADSTAYSWVLYAPTPPNPQNTIVDLTAATARMMIRSLPSDVTPLVSITSTLTAQGQLVLGGVLGTVSLNITKAATALLVEQGTGQLMAKYIYDIFIDFPNGTSLAIVSGNVNVRLAITH